MMCNDNENSLQFYQIINKITKVSIWLPQKERPDVNNKEEGLVSRLSVQPATGHQPRERASERANKRQTNNQTKREQAPLGPLLRT